MKVVRFIERWQRGLNVYLLGGLAWFLGAIPAAFAYFVVTLVGEQLSPGFEASTGLVALGGALLAPYILGGSSLRKSIIEIYEGQDESKEVRR